MISSREHLQYKMLIERVLLLVFYLVVFEKCCFKLIQMVDVLSNIGTVIVLFWQSKTMIIINQVHMCIARICISVLYTYVTQSNLSCVFFMFFKAVVPACKRTAEGFPRFLKIRATVLIILSFLMYIKFHWLLFEVF